MISWLQQHMLPCAFKYFFGIDCPICGAQRSLLLLMQGDFDASFKMYPPLLFVSALIFFATAYLLFPLQVKEKYLKYYSGFVLTVIIVNYTFKIVTNTV